MNRTTKILLVIVGLTLACCCLVAAVVSVAGPALATRALSQTFAEDPEQAAAIGAKIADYTPPPGYQEQFAMDMFGMRMVAIAPTEFDESAVLIMFMQVPAGWLDEEDMREQMVDAWAGQSGQRDLELQVVEQETRTIRGHPAVFTIYEGQTSDGDPMRQMVGVFQGKDGPTMLMIMGSPTEWNQETVDAFIDSIQ
jgi:hypothetical protein